MGKVSSSALVYLLSIAVMPTFGGCSKESSPANSSAGKATQQSTDAELKLPTDESGETKNKTIGGLSGGGAVRKVGMEDPTIWVQPSAKGYLFFNAGSERRTLQVNILEYKEAAQPVSTGGVVSADADNYEVVTHVLQKKLLLEPDAAKLQKYGASSLCQSQCELQLVDLETQKDLGHIIFRSLDGDFPLSALNSGSTLAPLSIQDPQWPILQRSPENPDQSLKFKLDRAYGQFSVKFRIKDDGGSSKRSIDKIFPKDIKCDAHCTVAVKENFLVVDVKPEEEFATFEVTWAASSKAGFRALDLGNGQLIGVFTK